MKKFEQPKYTIIKLSEDKKYAQFVIEPLERGFGTTIGNALRRVLLSSLPGASIYAVSIEGAKHEFSTIDGIEEDVMTIILNLKDLVLTIDDDENVTQELTISVNGNREVTGADIVCPLGVEVVNKDLHIANVAKGGKFVAHLYARNSRGYVTSETNSLAISEVGLIATDSKYSPVEKVAFNIEPTRVGQVATFEKLIVDIWTNGSIMPQEAIALAAHILVAHLDPIRELENKVPEISVMEVSKENKTNQTLLEGVDILGLTPRSSNCLARENIRTIGDLTQITEAEIAKIRNLGSKSLNEIKEKLKNLGLSFKQEEE